MRVPDATLAQFAHGVVSALFVEVDREVVEGVHERRCARRRIALELYPARAGSQLLHKHAGFTAGQ
ncbi:hypothetical protein [Pseudofrankia inefficax]|uniref:hypothetical protein n=1 Tax=Pseudofrankia inefficax (strain DSM 45817 / CECT 9037 / DDB 130130 / EuI1c) TaxID=298654 RepID=UPI00059C78D2|nr:hypothetical protein [Pseudofrankia inefficax]